MITANANTLQYNDKAGSVWQGQNERKDKRKKYKGKYKYKYGSNTDAHTIGNNRQMFTER